MNTDNHAYIHAGMWKIVFPLLKKICEKLPPVMLPKYPKTFTALNYNGIIRILINGIFV